MEKKPNFSCCCWVQVRINCEGMVVVMVVVVGKEREWVLVGLDPRLNMLKLAHSLTL